MNSSLQCLFRVPELRTALKQYAPGGQVPMLQDGSHKLTVRAAMHKKCRTCPSACVPAQQM